MQTPMKKTFTFKLDGSARTVTILHTQDLDEVAIFLNGQPVHHSRSRLNPNDFRFNLGSHVCFAQIYPTDTKCIYDLVVDGRSLEAQRQKRRAEDQAAPAPTTSVTPPASGGVRPLRPVDPSVLAVAEKPSQDTIRKLSEAETFVPRRGEATPSLRRAIELTLLEERKQQLNDRYELPYSLRIQEEDKSDLAHDYWRQEQLYEDRRAPWENETPSEKKRKPLWLK